MALDPVRADRWREGLLALGFVLVLVAAAWTVAVPELTKEPEGAEQAKASGSSAPAAQATPGAQATKK